MAKRLSTGVATLGLIIGLAPVEAGAKTICFVTFSLQVAYFQSSVEGGQKAAEELGHELIVLDPQADAGRQVTQVEDCIARNVDPIVVDPIESSSLLGVIEEAGQRGIPVASLDTPVDSPYVVTLVGVPQREASHTFGQFVAGWIVGKLGGEAKVGVMLASTEVQLARRDGFVDALKAVPGAEIVATGDGRKHPRAGHCRGRGHADRAPRHQRHLRNRRPAAAGRARGGASAGSRDCVLWLG
jgi:ribose transport system substrate-binding protein